VLVALYSLPFTQTFASITDCATNAAPMTGISPVCSVAHRVAEPTVEVQVLDDIDVADDGLRHAGVEVQSLKITVVIAHSGSPKITATNRTHHEHSHPGIGSKNWSNGSTGSMLDYHTSCSSGRCGGLSLRSAWGLKAKAGSLCRATQVEFLTMPDDVHIDAGAFQLQLGRLAEVLAQKLKREAVKHLGFVAVDLHVLVRYAIWTYNLLF